ncbi:MAG: VWA domain-containing protein [Pyrinomonadaceae bacterium]
MNRTLKTTLLAGVLAALILSPAAFGQRANQTSKDTQEDVLRINTTLVQTDVTVIDRKGQFVDNLQRDEFELKVDGKPQSLLFLERVTAGSASEANRIAQTRGETNATAVRERVERGRTVIFFMDDLHISPEGIARSRQVLTDFIDNQMTPGTQVLIASASGQIGFLQQFTNDKTVLRAALARLKYQSRAALDTGRPSMSAYQAVAIDRGDPDMLDYFIQQTRYEEPGRAESRILENIVRARARQIRRQAGFTSANAITALRNFIDTARGLAPGRRTLFFISEGFILDNETDDAQYKLRRVVDAAARNGVVVYTLSARGLAVGNLDASASIAPDLLRGSSARPFAGYSPTAELTAMQEILRTLAEDTGGRALFNANALEKAVSKTLAETSNYYLLAWRPENLEAEQSGKPKFHKIEIRVKGHSDLTARVRRGFFVAPVERDTPATPTTPANTPLNAAISAPNPRHELPVDLYVSATDDAQTNAVLNATVQLSLDGIQEHGGGGKRDGNIGVACVVLDDKGKVVFSNGRTITLTSQPSNETSTETSSSNGRERKLITAFSTPLTAPGLYQVRVAGQDSRNNLTGSAFAWIEVPNLKAHHLSLSSLLLVESRAANAANSAVQSPRAGASLLKVNRRFARSSRLIMQLYIYNAARGANNAPPDVEMEIKVRRDNQVVLNAAPHKVALAGASDLARIVYSAQIPLNGLSAGLYTLEVIATDRVAKTSFARQTDFTVE